MLALATSHNSAPDENISVAACSSSVSWSKGLPAALAAPLPELRWAQVGSGGHSGHSGLRWAQVGTGEFRWAQVGSGPPAQALCASHRRRDLGWALPLLR